MSFKFEVYAKNLPAGRRGLQRRHESPANSPSYFTTGGASGALARRHDGVWNFADFPGAYPVKVTKLVPNERIEFTWEADERTATTPRSS